MIVRSVKIGQSFFAIDAIDIIDAIIYLEQMKKSSKLKIKAKAEEVLGKDTEQIKDQLKEMLKKSNVIRIVIEKEDNKLTIEQDNTTMRELITTNNVELKVEDSVKEETNSTSKLITDEPTKTTITSKTNRRGRRKKNNK